MKTRRKAVNRVRVVSVGIVKTEGSMNCVRENGSVKGWRTSKKVRPSVGKNSSGKKNVLNQIYESIIINKHK